MLLRVKQYWCSHRVSLVPTPVLALLEGEAATTEDIEAKYGNVSRRPSEVRRQVMY
eukprot:EC788427.1.p1 GENE.EC788427.1~~EC788427.1.p1  ORF type:complete len:56 (+),score=1.21 EC788427.1:82-249(+)